MGLAFQLGMAQAQQAEGAFYYSLAPGRGKKK